MTAFEILLNKFYDTIENNEPENSPESRQAKSAELIQLIRNYIEISFVQGEYLSSKNKLSELLEKSAETLQNTPYEDWLKVKYTFVENDLHIIRRDRNKSEIQQLKMRLDKVF